MFFMLFLFQARQLFQLLRQELLMDGHRIDFSTILLTAYLFFGFIDAFRVHLFILARYYCHFHLSIQTSCAFQTNRLTRPISCIFGIRIVFRPLLLLALTRIVLTAIML